MKHTFLSIPALVLGAGLLLLAPTSAFSGKQGEKTPHARTQARHAMAQHAAFDSSKIETVQGKVTKVFTPKAGSAAGGELRLTLKTDKGNMPVVVGPTSYIEKDNFKISQGDNISVTGSRVMMHRRAELVATQIKKGDKTLELRKNDGTPLWSTQGSSGR